MENNEPKLLRDYTEELGVPIKAFDVDGITRFFCMDENGKIVQIYVKDDSIYDSPFGILDEMSMHYKQMEQLLIAYEDLTNFPRDRELFEHFWGIANENETFDFLPIKELVFPRYITHMIVRK